MLAAVRVAVAVAVGTLAVVGSVSAQPAPGDWPQWGRSPTQQSYNGVASTTAKGKEWTFTPKDRVVASPAVAFGRVYIGSDDGHMYCLDQASGSVMWSFEIPYTHPQCKGFYCEHGFCPCNHIRSNPAVDMQGNVYFGAYDRSFYKVNQNGSMVWNISTGGTIYGGATIGSDGTVYIGSFDNNLYALSPDDGKVLWKKDLKAHGDCGIALGEGDWSHILVTQSNEGGDCTHWPPPGQDKGECYVYALEKATGKELWRHKTGKPAGGGMIVNDTYISGSWNRYATSLNLKDGSLNWRRYVGGEVETRPAYHDGVVYISAEESMTLFALNYNTGAIIWEYKGATQELNGSPSVSGDIVYVGSNDKYLHAVDRATGKLRFKIKTCANVFASAAIADNGMVYVGCNTATGGPGAGSQPGVGAAYAINPTLHGPDEE